MRIKKITIFQTNRMKMEREQHFSSFFWLNISHVMSRNEALLLLLSDKRKAEKSSQNEIK